MGPNAAKRVLSNVVDSIRAHCHAEWQTVATLRELVCEELNRIVAIRKDLALSVRDEFPSDREGGNSWVTEKSDKVFALSLVSEKLDQHPQRLEDTIRRLNAIMGTKPVTQEELQGFGFTLTQA